MIKAIIFDFTQTLVDSSSGFRLAEKRVQKDIFSFLKLSDWDKFITTYREIRVESLALFGNSRFRMWQKVCNNFNPESETSFLQELEQEYWDIVTQHTFLFPETLIVLDKLAKTYKLGLISNTQGQPGNARNHLLMEFKILDSYFQSIVIAGEDSIPPKPDSTPFKICLDQLKTDASDAIYVGDDWENDVNGSRRAGLEPVWLKHERVKRNWPDKNSSVTEICNLEQLLVLFADDR